MPYIHLLIFLGIGCILTFLCVTAIMFIVVWEESKSMAASEEDKEIVKRLNYGMCGDTHQLVIEGKHND